MAGRMADPPVSPMLARQSLIEPIDTKLMDYCIFSRLVAGRCGGLLRGGLLDCTLSPAATSPTFARRATAPGTPKVASTSDRRDRHGVVAGAAHARAIKHCSDYGIADCKLVSDQQAERDR